MLHSFDKIFLLFVLWILTIFAVGLYFLPTLIAFSMHHRHILAIFLLNLFAGWTGAGWLGALLWAILGA